MKHRLASRWRLCLREERGLSLVESVVAVAILGTAVVAFIAALSTGSLGVQEHSQEVVAQQLAQTQLEVIKAASYSTTGAGYPTVATPAGYAIAFTVNSTIYADDNIQKVTVTVSRDGSAVLVKEGYKVNR